MCLLRQHQREVQDGFKRFAAYLKGIEQPVHGQVIPGFGTQSIDGCFHLC